MTSQIDGLHIQAKLSGNTFPDRSPQALLHSCRHHELVEKNRVYSWMELLES